jgi:hypothetical protein
VLAKFLTAPRPVAQGKPQGSGAANASAVPAKKIDYTKAESEVLALNRAGKLNDQTINRFAVRSEYINVVAALSLKTDVKDRGNRALDGERPAVWADRGMQGRQAELVDNDNDHPQPAWLPAGHAT